MDAPSETKFLDKELTRKQFLQLLFSSGLALFGFSNFIGFIKMMDFSKSKTADDGHGFGTRKFGV